MGDQGPSSRSAVAESDEEDMTFLGSSTGASEQEFFELESGGEYDEEDEEEEIVQMLDTPGREKDSFPAAEEEELRQALEEDLPKDLRNRPVVTRRTISLMSASAPNTQFQNFIEASLNTVIPNKHPERQYADQDAPAPGTGFPSISTASVKDRRKDLGRPAKLVSSETLSSLGSPQLEKARSRLRDRDRWGAQGSDVKKGEYSKLDNLVAVMEETSGDQSFADREEVETIAAKEEAEEGGLFLTENEMPWPRKGVSFFSPPSPEHERRLSKLPESETGETIDRLNLLHLDDKVVVGSVPKKKFIDEVLVQGTNSSWNVPPAEKSCKQRRRRSVKAPKGQQQKAPHASKVNRHRKFITIPTLSFNDRLSPETPQFVLGSTARNAKKLLITVAIHGDEPCGMIAFNELLREGFFDKMPKNLQLTAIVGNPAAVVQRKRFIEFNMNRIIREDFFRKKHYECERGRVVARAISLCDILLDLHSCSADAPAHALPGADISSVTIASRLPVAYVIKNLVHTTEGQATTVDWAVNHNKIGLCVECGQHDKRETVENAKRVIQAMVNADYVTMSKSTAKPVILHSTENEKVRKGFKFTRKIKAFDCVPFGESIAQDDVVGDIKSKYRRGTYVVMPTSRPVLGEEAFFYAKLSAVKRVPARLF